MEVYQDIIKNKFKLSNKYFNYKLDSKDPESKYLYYFDLLNVYPLFPTIIDLQPISNKTILSPEIINNSPSSKSTKTRTTELENLIKQLGEKMELLKFSDDEVQNRQRGMVRKLFSYEIIDELKDHFNAEYVTTAWLKCYEIIHYFGMVQTESDTVKYFGICEQPGAFIYAINHYVKTELGKKFDFVVQSLVDPHNKKIFKPEPNMYRLYKENYDYGATHTGDVTVLENIKYYRKKYYSTHFDIITADCGLDCSAEPMNQEKDLLIVIIGQMLVALSLADKGTNYFFKLFTIYENVTYQMIWLLSMFFTDVRLCRTLTTKPESGEIYCVCLKFKYTKQETDSILDSLYSWYGMFHRDKTIDLVKSGIIDDSFSQKMNEINQILLWRRITSMNWLYFRFKNNEYAQSKKKIYDYVNKLVEHYTQYFLKIYHIQKLPDEYKLVK